MTGLPSFIAQAFVSGLWQGAVLSAAVAAALRLFPRLTPATRFTVWGAAFLAIAAVPFLHLAAPAATQPSPALHLGLGWALAIAACWTILFSLRLVRLALHLVRLRRICTRATPIPQNAAVQTILDLSGRHPALCSSPDVDVPSVIGFFAPRLLLPASLLPSLSRPELLQIVQHECEHLRRRDDWINLLQKLALALFPLNPALLFVDRRLGLERELACDAAVVLAEATPFAYANALTRLAEHRLLHRPLALALSAWGRQSELARRVQLLLRPNTPMSAFQARCVMTLLGLALAGGTSELTRTPTLISFAPAIPASIAESSPVSIPAGQAHPLAVVYHPPTEAPPQPLRIRIHKASLKTTVSRAPLPQSAPPRLQVLLTSAPSQPAPDAPRLVPAVWNDFSPTYAAIQVADGWLILQL